MPNVKIVMLGSGGVGKSAITVQLVSKQFVQVYDPTIEDSYRTTITIGQDVFVVTILDTAGQEELASLRDSYMRHGDGYVLVYSITSVTSFLDLNNIRQQIFRILEKDESEKLPIVIAGNKCDMVDDRQVNTSEVEEISKQWGVKFFETSAKTRVNIEELFYALLLDIKQIKGLTSDDAGEEGKPEKKKKSCALL